LITARRTIVAIALVALALVPPSSAPAARQHVELGLSLTNLTPGAATGMRLRLGLPDRNGKPPVLRRIVYELPPGTAIDATVVPACRATEDDLNTRGSGACPAATKVGGGTLTAVTGFGPPVAPLLTEATIFQGVGEFIEVFTPPGSDRVLAIDHAKIGPGTLTLSPPPSPGGPPDGHSTPRDIDFVFPERSIDGRPLLRTPPGCAGPGGWVSRVTATYDGGETETATATTPCRTAGGAIVPPPARLRLTVAPRRVAVGRRVRFRLRVSGPPACVAAASVRFHGRRWSVRRDGSVLVDARFDRPGAQRATVAARGCRPAATTVEAVP